MPTIPNRTRYASFGVAATIFEAADASKTYVRMPTSNATIEPRTTGTCTSGCARVRATTGRTRHLTSCGSLPWCFHLLAPAPDLRAYGYWDNFRTDVSSR